MTKKKWDLHDHDLWGMLHGLLDVRKEISVVLPLLEKNLGIMDRVVAARRAANRADQLREKGAVVKYFSSRDKQNPFRYKTGSRGYCIDDSSGLLDHQYTVKYPDGTVEYVSEPYSVSGESIKKLAELHDAGCRVCISNVGGLHYPGSCLVVSIEPPPHPTN